MPTRMHLTSRAILLIGCASALMVVSNASAHVSLQPARTEAAAEALFTILAPGEHQQRMVGVSLSLPGGMTVKDGNNTGWRFELKRRVAKWSHGAAAPFAPTSLTLLAVGPTAPGSYELDATQTYADGHTDSWKVPLTVVPEPPGQNLVAAAIVGAVGISTLVAIVALRAPIRRRGGRA